MRRALVAILLGLFGIMAVGPVAAATSSVKTRDDYFTPDFRVLVVGDKVQWQVEGGNGHTITSYPGSPTDFDSSPETTDTCETTPGSGGGIIGGDPEPPVVPDCLYAGAIFEETFDTVGTIDYYCKIHGNPKKRPKASANAASQKCGMCGRLVVKVPSTMRPAPDNDDVPSQTTSPDPTASESGDTSTPSPSPSIDPSLIAGPGDAQGPNSAGTIIIASFALALLSGLGYLVWRRYFQSA